MAFTYAGKWVSGTQVYTDRVIGAPPGVHKDAVFVLLLQY